MTLNPACTPGTVTGRTPGHITAACGCGWTETGQPSRSAAKRAQRAHRFPDRDDEPRDRGPLAVAFLRPS